MDNTTTSTSTRSLTTHPSTSDPSLASSSGASGGDTSSFSKRKNKGRTFQCIGYPECNMTFTRSEHLARHIRKHTGERPFECVHCSRKFSRLDNLRQHKQTVHAHERIILSYVNDKPVSKKNELQQVSDSIPIQQSLTLPEDQQSPLRQRSPLTTPFSNGSSSTITDTTESNEPSGAQSKQIVQSDDSDLPPASVTLMRPTQFRSKHRPRPLALPNRKSIYTDAPYTVPTPRSSGSTHFILSPISPSHHQPPLSATIQSSSNNLPSFQFLTSANVGDSLISPYNSSFNSSVYSASNTPINSSFDLKTPTSGSFEFLRNVNQSGGSTNSSLVSNYEQNRRSWLNNVLNVNELNGNSNNNSNNNNTNNENSNGYLPRSPNQQYLAPIVGVESKKLKIESLLNSNQNKLREGAESGDFHSENHLEQADLNDRIRLPPVDNLGIQRS